MSTVDNRIVRMQFDNEQFERGVMQSMRTLDELNEKLQFKEAGKGISALQVHLNNVDFSGIQNAVQHINHSFTSMTGMVAQRIKEDIVDNVINAAKKLEQVTLGQIKSGGMARAKNLANAKFMIEGLKFDWEAVRKAADYAVTDTAYGLDAAAKAASQLAASGVDFMETIEEVNGTKLTQMHKSLRAISGVAAMTNSSYEEIAHIFTAVAGMGKLTTMQLNQLSLRGLNIASTIAEQTGKTEQEIREMVTQGTIDFQMFSEAMDNAYGEHAKEANKTFEGSLSNLKAALSRVGAIFTQPVIDKTNTFFIALTGRIKEFQKALSDDKSVRVTEKALKRITKAANDEAKAHKLSGTEYVRYVNDTIAANKKAILENKQSLTNGDAEEYSIARFATHFAEAWEAAINFVSKVTESLDLSWFKSIGSFLDGAAQKVTKFFNSAATAIDKVKASVDKTSASIADSLELDMNDLDLLHRILYNEFGFVEERWAKLDEIYKKQGSTKTGLWLQGYMDQLAGVGYHFEKLGWTEEEFKKKQEELAKSEAERVQEMTKEELLINRLTKVYVNLKKTISGIKTTITNAIKVFSNVATAIARVVSYADNLGNTFQVSTIFEGTAKISEALVNLSEAIQPSTDSLETFGGAIEFVGMAIDSAVRFIFDTTAAFIDFVAACLKADESLDELSKNEGLTSMQRVALDLLRILKNIGRFFSALGKIALKIFKSIKTAFVNVFGGKEVGGALTAVTGGITLFTDGLATAAEKVAEAEAPFKAIEYIFGAVFTVVKKVSDYLGKFTTGIRKFKNGTEDTTEAVEGVIKVGEKSSSFMEGLGKVFAKGVKWVTELPDKLVKLWEAIKQQEGVQKLKESFENLWKTIKDSFNKGVGPMTRGMNDLTKVTGGEGSSAIEAFADGIGKVAGKIAEYIDKLPEYGAKIKKFFEDVKTWFDKTIADLHLDELGGGLADAFKEIFSSDKSIFAKVKEFAEEIFYQVIDALSGVNWKEVGKGGIMALVAANLFEFFKATSGIAEAIDRIKAIPKSINGVIKAIGSFLGVAQKSLAKATNAYVLANAAKTILAMAAAIVLLKDIPKDDLNKALAAITMMGFIIFLLLKGIGWLSMGLAAKSEKIIDNSTKNLLQVNRNLGRFAGVAMLVFAVGGSIWLVANSVKAIVEASNALQTNGNILGGFSAAVQTLMDIIKWVGIIAIALLALSKITLKLPVIGKAFSIGGSSGGAMEAIGVALIGIGVAVAAMAAALYMMSKIDIKNGAIIAFVGIVSSIIIMTYVLGQSARWADTGALLALALDMFVMSVAIGIILGELAAISLLLTGASFLGKENILLEAAAMIALIIVAMGASIGMMAKGVSKFKKPGDIVSPILAMAAVIITVAWAMKTVAAAAGSNLQGTVIAFFAIIAVIGMVAMVIDKTVGQIRRGKSDDMTNVFLSLAAIFAAVGVCVLLLAVAAKEMASVGDNLGKALIGALAIVGLAVIAIIAVVAIAKKANASVIAEILESMSIAFIAIGASVLLIAEAAKVLADVGIGAIVGIAAILVIMLGAFGLLAFFVSKNPMLGEGLKKLGEGFKAFGIGMLLIAASALVFGLAMGIIASGLGLLASGIGVLANAFSEHKATVLVLLGIIALTAILAALLIKACEPIPPIVEKVADVVTTTAKKTGGGLLNVLKSSGSKISAWWQSMQPRTKAMIVTGIGTLCAAILKSTPQVLNTAKALLGKLVGFLLDIIPDAVAALLDILIKLVNSLANEIRENSARIAYAFWNLFESLLEVAMEVLGQLINLLLGGLGGGAVAKAVNSKLADAKGWLRSNLAVMEEYADGAEDAAERAKKSWLEYNAENGGSDADEALRKAEAALEDTGNAADSTSDSISKLTDTFSTYKDIASDKIRIDGVPIEIPKNVVNDEGQIIGSQLTGGIVEGMDMNGINLNNVMPDMESMGNYQGEGLINGMDTAIDDGGDELYTTTTTTVKEGPIAGIEDMEGEVRKTAREYINDVIRDEISDEGYRKTYETRMWSNGGYLMRGLTEGIDSHLYLVENEMGKVTKAVNGSFIGPMKISSPSKVFIQNGAYLLQGLAQGIMQNLGLVENASGEMSNTIMESFGPALDYVAKVQSGEFQYDPTIRPVLDSSNIGRGAGAINSMFRNQTVSLSGFSGQLAADIGQLDSRNLDVVMELRALREEMAVMGEEISNMQVVMDTGALVGATAGPMDKALGQRAVRFGRGT